MVYSLLYIYKYSTTAAIIALLLQVATLLNTNSFIVMISMDFAKAFDTVRHSFLLARWDNLDLPATIHNWIINHFKDWGHVTMFTSETSDASIVLGSVLGSPFYMIGAPGLHPVHQCKLWAHGLSPPFLHEVARAMTIAHLMYAFASILGVCNRR